MAKKSGPGHGGVTPLHIFRGKGGLSPRRKLCKRGGKTTQKQNLKKNIDTKRT